MDKVLVIVGPTALGKTDLALSLAKQFKGELVACDSRQIYKGLKLGAGKGEEKVWMYDVADPRGRYSAAQYVKEATKVVEEVLKRKKLPIIVGGTGLYLRALLGEINDLEVPPNEELRSELEELSVIELQKKVQILSPIVYQEMNLSDVKNKRRLIRKIEQLTMYPHKGKNQKSKVKQQKWDTLKIGLTAPRQTLFKRIDQRVLSRLDQDMLEEAKQLNKKGLSFERMKELGLEYGIMAEYLERKINYKEMVEKMKNKIHQYAKRQLVWFKKDKTIHWFDITNSEFYGNLVRVVQAWYDPLDAA